MFATAGLSFASDVATLAFTVMFDAVSEDDEQLQKLKRPIKTKSIIIFFRYLFIGFL